MCALSLLALASAAAPARAGDDDVKAVVEKAIKAQGGGDEAAKYPAARVSSKGKFYGMGDGIDFTSTSAVQQPDRSRFEVTGDQFKFVQVVNGDKGWVKINDNVDEMNKEQLAEARETLHVGAVQRLIGLTGKDYKLSSLGDSKVGDKAAVGVRVERKGRRDVNLYFDKDSGLLLRLETRVKDLMADKEVTEERLFSDYKKEDGVQIPQKVLINRDGKKYVESETTDFKREEKLDASLFDKP
jgi:hypothetical protein